MKKRLNVGLVVALLIVMCFSMSACKNSDNKGKQNPTGQTEGEKIPTLEEVLEEQEDDEDETEDIEDHQDDVYENTYIDEPSMDEVYEEEF